MTSFQVSNLHKRSRQEHEQLNFMTGMRDSSDGRQTIVFTAVAKVLLSLAVTDDGATRCQLASSTSLLTTFLIHSALYHAFHNSHLFNI
jgi:hypothetical protein